MPVFKFLRADAIDPLIEDIDQRVQEAKEASDAAVEAAQIAEHALFMKQHVITAVDGQTRLDKDNEGVDVRAIDGVAQVNLQGLGLLTPGEDYTVDSEGTIVVARELDDGELITVTTYPRLTNTDVQAVLANYRDGLLGAAERAENASTVAEASAAIVLGTATDNEKLIAWASAEAWSFINVTYDADGVPDVGSELRWPDGTVGTLSSRSKFSSIPSLLTSYRLSHPTFGRHVTQPVMTRDEFGRVTARPSFITGSL
jgi:hypothetical protein